ncbi:inositol monophosphatase 3-like [Ciona intestinalis]
MTSKGIRVLPMRVALLIVVTCLVVYYFVSKPKSEPEGYVDLHRLLVAGISAAEMGGNEVRRVREGNTLGEKSKGETLEGVNDPLTMGDTASHRVMYHSLKAAFPMVHVVSEETDVKDSELVIRLPPLANEEVGKMGLGSEVVNASDVTMWIDPLDATKEYTEKLLQYVTTMVCVAVDGKPVIGIIHKPFERKTYWSWVGHGTNIDDKSNDDITKIIVSLSHKGDVEDVAKRAFGDVSVIGAGGAGYKSLALFDGTASVYVHTTRIKKWDICAGNAIVRNAGGHMTTLTGSDIDYSSRGSPINDKGLVAAVRKHQHYLTKLNFGH